MTDDWKVPDDLADRVANANYADAWRLEIERTAQVRGILTDLIAQLGGVHRYVADLDGTLRLCAAGCGVMPCASLRIADCAEARLREVGGGE